MTHFLRKISLHFFSLPILSSKCATHFTHPTSPCMDLYSVPRGRRDWGALGLVSATRAVEFGVVTHDPCSENRLLLLLFFHLPMSFCAKLRLLARQAPPLRLCIPSVSKGPLPSHPPRPPTPTHEQLPFTVEKEQPYGSQLLALHYGRESSALFHSSRHSFFFCIHQRATDKPVCLQTIPHSPHSLYSATLIAGGGSSSSSPLFLPSILLTLSHNTSSNNQSPHTDKEAALLLLLASFLSLSLYPPVL